MHVQAILMLKRKQDRNSILNLFFVKTLTIPRAMEVGVESQTLVISILIFYYYFIIFAVF